MAIIDYHIPQDTEDQQAIQKCYVTLVSNNKE